MASCPECDAVLDVEDDEVEAGEVINCPECGLELEIIHTNPIEVETIEDEENGDDNENDDQDEDDEEDQER